MNQHIIRDPDDFNRLDGETLLVDDSGDQVRAARKALQEDNNDTQDH